MLQPSVALLALLAAAAPGPAIDTQHIRLELTVDEKARRIAGRAIETLRVSAGTSVVELDAVGLEIKGVKSEDGRALPFETTSRSLRVSLDSPPLASELTLTIDYAAKPSRGVYFVAPGLRRPKLAHQVWTSSWPEDARYWFPCHDDLADKTTSELLLTVPRDWQAVSNGALLESRAAGSTRLWHWKTEQPHSTYLISFVAGDYEQVRDDASARVPVSYFVYRGRDDDARRSFAHTPEMIRFFEAETAFDYPFAKFSQAIAADFVFGGMENVSAVTLSDGALLEAKARADRSSDPLIAHELAHQWWGDTVSPASWADVWLSEGFATYFADLWREKSEGEDAASYARLKNADAWLALDAEQRSRPVVFDDGGDPNRYLDANTYQKGSLVLGLLRQMLGDEAFRRGLQSYIGRYAFRSATTDDFARAMEEAARHDLSWFFEQWLREPGVPYLTVSWRWDSAGRRVVLVVRQAEDKDGPARVFQLPVQLRLVAADGRARAERIFVERAEQEFSIPSETAPASVVFDSGGYILKKLRVEKPLDELAFDVASAPTAADRALAVRALGDQGAPALAALTGALQRDRFWGVRSEAAAALGHVGGDSAVAALRAGATDADPNVREAVMRAFAHAGSPDVARDLFAALASDASERVQAEALRSLGSLRAQGAFDALSRALTRESHAEGVRIAALEGLALLNDGRGVPLALEQAAEGGPSALRVAAVRALGELGRGQGVALGRLQRLLDDTQAPVRRAAAEALGALGDASSLAALRDAMTREDVPSVRRAIEKAEGRLASPRAQS